MHGSGLGIGVKSREMVETGTLGGRMGRSSGICVTIVVQRRRTDSN